MLLQGLWIRKMPLVALLVSGIASFALVTLGMSFLSSTAEAGHGEETKATLFSSLTDAESVVQFPLKALDASSTDLTFQVALVDASPPILGGADVTLVEAIWSDPGGDWVRLFQGPGTGRIANATQTIIEGREFETLLAESTHTRPFGIAALGWEEQERRYMITLPFLGDGAAALKRAAEFASGLR